MEQIVYSEEKMINVKGHKLRLKLSDSLVCDGYFRPRHDVSHF